jgi:Putative peptidoglycan binding domain
MRIFLVLVCSFALASLALGAQQEKKKEQPKKKQAQSAQHAARPGGGPQKAKGSQKVATPGGHRAAVTQPSSVSLKSAGGGSAQGAGAQKTKKAKGSQKVATASLGAQKTKEKTQGSQQIATQGGQAAGGAAGVQKTKKSKKSAQQVTTSSGQIGAGGAGVQKTKGAAATAAQAKAKPFKSQHFNLASKSKPATSVAPAVTFQQNRRIQGSQNWQGSNYQVFRNYRSEWHDRDWWRRSHSRIVFVFGGWYYWNSGYWFPAWGYDPGAYYAYDGPIYAYNNLPPDQVIANVQAALQQQGYYHGEVDGLLGPLTREAVASYQRDHGLYTTSTIDRPTLESLGMA